MDVKLLTIFIVLNIVNVITQTVKSIATLKCGKGAAAAVNAVAYGLYTIVTVYMMCNLPLYWKAGIVAVCNLVGVYAVKWAEEKAHKDKLWKVEMTVLDDVVESLNGTLNSLFIPHNYFDCVGKYSIVNVYCATQKESLLVKEIADKYNAKYFVSETKIL